MTDSTRPVRWGILGASRFALKETAPALHGARGAVLAALATRDSRKAQPFQDLAPGLKLHDSYDALLHDPSLDAVYIPLPNTAHAPYAQAAMRAGKAVLVEKPIGMSVPEIDALITTSAETGQLCAEAFMPVHHPQWAQVANLLADGAVGRLRMIRGLFTYSLNDPGNIRAQASLGGGGLRDVGIYPIGMACQMMNQTPTEVTAHMQMQNGVDILAEIRARFGDVIFQAVCGTSAMRAQSFELHGTEGVISLEAPFNPGSFAEGAVVLRRPDHGAQIWRYPGVQQYIAQFNAFCDALRGGAPFPLSLEQSRRTQSVIDACFAAAQTYET